MISSCSDPAISPRKPTNSTNEADEVARKFKTPVSSFTFNGRLYEFVYDSNGKVASITASQGSVAYMYVTHYEGDRLISADLVEDGKVMSSNTNFEYDKKGRVLSYDYVSYFFPEYPEGVTQHYTVSYDKKGNMIQAPDGSQLASDNRGNIIQWGGTSFTFERASNPFYQIPDLWMVFVEEPFFWEFILSPNNATSRTAANGAVTTYQNQYDASGRLISRTGYMNGQEIEEISLSY